MLNSHPLCCSSRGGYPCNCSPEHLIGIDVANFIHNAHRAALACQHLVGRERLAAYQRGYAPHTVEACELARVAYLAAR